MNYKTIILVATVNITLLNAVDKPPMPPMPPMISIKKSKTVKQNLPQSCQVIPPMIFKLPPPMENELIKCKNELNIPKINLVEKRLSKLLKKKVKVKSIEILKKFNQVYKITYNGGIIFTNHTVDAFIK